MGDYRVSEDDGESQAPKITHGHSKDKRPDLKQFMTELLCVERGVPIFGSTLDGNSSDKTSNNKILSRISGIMSKHGLGPGTFVYVADSAMMTKKNLGEFGDNKFVSRLPANFATCDEAIAKAVDNGAWIELGTLAEAAEENRQSYRRFRKGVGGEPKRDDRCLQLRGRRRDRLEKN